MKKKYPTQFVPFFLLDNFDLGETATTGVCTDSFDVTVSSGRDYQTLCGTNTGNYRYSRLMYPMDKPLPFAGQHIFLETGRATTGQKLTFTLAASGASATWRVKVSQMACYDAWK